MLKPCNNCPFRTDKIFPLKISRRKEIAEVILKDSAFYCHKYLEEEKDKICIGAGIFLENVAPGGFRANLAFRLAMISGEISPDRLCTKSPVAKTVEEFIYGNQK